MIELHYTKKDFTLEWFSGSGAGGQHRNKHQNCCRITHNDSGITTVGTESRSRVANQRKAFETLAAKLIALTDVEPERRDTNEVIRVYHSVRNDVLDKLSGKHKLWGEVIKGDGLHDLIVSRRKMMV